MTGTLDLACPYCKEQLNVNHDDGRGREENVKHEMHVIIVERILFLKQK